VSDGMDTLGVFEQMLISGEDALNQTPDMLPVLKKAGVVDAGGKGLLVIFEGMMSVFKDNLIIPSSSGEQKAVPVQRRSAAAESEGEITFTYCTEFIVKRKKADAKDPLTLRAYLETIGDCVVVVDDDEIIKVHVHTDHPGQALERALTYGQLINLKIENMREQHEAMGETDKESLSVAEGFKPVEITGDIGFVSIAAGDGLRALFEELGADRVVSGGQTMNPSTDDILRAVEATPSKTVFVLPNNKNIIMAAEQAVPLSSRKVIVLPTRTIPQGISAMLSFDPDLDEDKNAIAMQSAADAVSTGQITFAARDSSYDGNKITKGELLALANGKVAFTEKSLDKCVTRLIKLLVNRDTAFITLIYGEDVNEESALAVKNAVCEKISNDIEVTLVNGGQPVYYFIISVE
ncbi:MAG: DAK2 domain-containing protein, partial [Oscillospiraceae bacterium]